MRRVIILAGPDQRQRALDAICSANVGDVVTISEPRRNSDQNARMWAMLSDVAGQVDWYGKRLTAEDWKHVFSSSLRKLEVVPNLDGTGFVALGLSTSRMSVREMSDLIELLFAFGAERGVKWTDPAERRAA
jgi:hypothetical protein